MKNITQVKKSAKYKSIMKIVKNNRLIKDRVAELKRKGFVVGRYPMGSGVVGQVKSMRQTFRIQIGYGQGKNNYAHVVSLPKK